MYNKKVLSEAKRNLNSTKAPAKKKDMIIDPMGQWKHPGENTRIPGNDITMQGVPYPVWAVPNVGTPQMMYPEQDYYFPGADHVDEYPQMQSGGSIFDGLIEVDYPTEISDEITTRNPDGTISTIKKYYEYPTVKKSYPQYLDEWTNTTPEGKRIVRNAQDRLRDLKNKRAVWEREQEAKGATEEERKKLMLQPVGEYKFAQGGDISIPDLTDYEDGGEYDLTQEEIDDLIAQGYVVEDADEYKKGGTPRALPKKKSSKGYSRSLTATNKLFAQNPLTKKSKSKKNKIFDPNAKYYQYGGQDGPRTENENTPEITRENLNSIYPVFRNLGHVELTADPNFTSKTSGRGSIEYISPERGDEPIRYPSGYELVAPKPGVHNIVYDPNSNNINNVALDLFTHGLRDTDPIYQKYLKEFTDVYNESPRANSMRKWYAIDEAAGDAPDGREAYENNWIDGDLRGIFHRGTDAQKMDEHYYPKQYEETTAGSPELVNKIEQIRKYIETPHLDYLEKSLQLPKNQKGGFQDDLGKHRQLLRDWTYGQSIGMLQKAQLGLIKSPYQLPAGTKHPMQVVKQQTPKNLRRQYNALEDVKPQVSESTKPKQTFKPDVNLKDAVQIKKDELNAAAFFVSQDPLLSEKQKADIMMDTKKLEDNIYRIYTENPSSIKQVSPQSKSSRVWEYITNPLTAAEYAISGGGAENMPRNINTMKMAGIDPGVSQGRNLVGNTLNEFYNLADAADKVRRYTGQGDYSTAALEALRFLPGAKTLGKRVKAVGKEFVNAVPEYKNVYRVEPTSFTKDPTDQLSGRWFGSLEEMPFYVKNLKDPNAGVRIMRTKLPVKKWEKISGLNMPEQAKFMSAGTGKYNTFMDAVNAGELSAGAAKRLSKGVQLPSDLNELTSNPNLINLTEGIVPENLVSKIRTQSPSKFSRSQKVEFPAGSLGTEGAHHYIYNIQNEVEKPILGIPRKYVPFEEGGETDYEDLDLTPEEIDWYLANGYDLEDLGDSETFDDYLPEAQTGFVIEGKTNIVPQKKKTGAPTPSPVVTEDVVVSKTPTEKLVIQGKTNIVPKTETRKRVQPPVENAEGYFAKSPYAYQSLSGYMAKNPIVPEQVGLTPYAASLIEGKPHTFISGVKKEKQQEIKDTLVPGYTVTDQKLGPSSTAKFTEKEEEQDVAKVNPKVKNYQSIVNKIDKDIQKVYYDLTNPNLKPSEKIAARQRYKELTTKRGSYIKAINSVKRDEVGWFDAAINESPTVGKPLQKWGLADQPSYMTYDLPKFESYTDKQKKEQEEFKQSTRFENLNPNKSEFTRWKFRAAASNDDPLKVAIYGTRGERANQNIDINSPGSIMHFLDQSPESGWISPETQTFYRNLKDNDYVGYLKPNGDGTHSIQYLPKKDFTKDNLYKNTFLVRQVKFDNIDFNNKVKDDNFAGHTYPTIKGTKQVALPISSDPDENVYDYSSGQSVVFIFKYNGKTRYQHFAGSRNEIKKEGEELKKMYKLKDGALTIGLADAGSYSSAVSGKITNDKLNSKDYGYYNPNGNTGAGMAILPN